MMEEYKDYMVDAIAGNESIRAYAVTSRNLVEYARKAHNLSPIATAALGRTMSVTVLMGSMLKNESDTLTIQINGNGPLKNITAVSDNGGNVRGYVANPYVILPPEANGHLNVGGGVGQGTLMVIRDLGLKEPYVSTIPLRTGEIGDDFTYYFAQSEQTPSSVGLGVLLNKENVTVAHAGGFILQLLPNCPEEIIEKLEANLKEFKGVTETLKEEDTPEHLLKTVLKGFDIDFLSKKDVQFKCNCSYERGLRVLSSLGEEELKKIVGEGKPVEVSCSFCGKKYDYSLDVLKDLEKKAHEEAGKKAEKK